MITMKPEIKALLLAALRSDEYEQGQHQLRSDDRFCCLGVTCDLYIKITGKGKWQGDAFIDEDGESQLNVLPKCVQEWAGIDEENPFIPDYEFDTLAEANDGGKTFEEIADIIDDNF